ncbi:MAG: Lrp/AsnC family transcriptional regulator [Acidimicrobiia bacterium]|nr:Lrp/AsnC family transcriptional regulator [Acidimicrobiia bacterium]MDX2468694.1 Lrp/AsnC family transcriptional regulator [Acidimicrobiia bacterium]
MTYHLDPTDRAILAVLGDDGRISNVALAEKVHLSPSACLRRLRRLEDGGVIDRYAAVIDPAKIGKATSVFVDISLSSQRDDLLDSFEAAVKDVPGVMSCHLMAGDADYVVQILCADVEDYERIHRSYLSRLPGVIRLRSSFALRTVCSKPAYEIE